MKIKIIPTLSWRGDILALAGGLLVPFAFAPYKMAPIVILSMCALLLAWHECSNKRTFFRGWLFGLAMFGFGVSWIHISMHRFGGVSEPLSIFLTVLFVAFLALFPALTGYLAKRFFAGQPKHTGIFFLLAIPALWTVVEWIRGMIFTGFPWLSLGYSQIDMPLGGAAPILGVFGLSYLLVLTSGLLIYAYTTHPQNYRKPLWAIAAIWVIPGLLSLVSWTQPEGDPITLSLVQGNVTQDKKWLPEQRLPTLNLYAKLSRENWSSDVVIWPETAVPAFYHIAKPFLKSLAQEARLNGSELLVGLPIYNDRLKTYYNSMISLGRDESFYEKRHLVPFGEYLPLPDILGSLITFFDIPMSDFSPGDPEASVVKVAGIKVGISICYEDAFGEEIAYSLPDAKLLINTSNDAWFGDSIAPHQHLEIARMRALETGRYLVRSTNTGISAFIDDKGDIISTSPQFETHVLTEKVQPMSGMTFYAIFTNMPIVIVSIGLLCIALWFRRKHLQVKVTPAQQID